MRQSPPSIPAAADELPKPKSMAHMRRATPVALWVYVFALLFGATFKAVADEGGTEAWASSGLGDALRSFSTPALLLIPLCLLVSAANSKNWKLKAYGLTSTLILLFFIEVLRAAIGGTTLYLKVAASLLVIIATYAQVAIASNSVGYVTTRRTVLSAMTVFASALVVANVALLLQGAAISPYNHRFIGTSQHANFIGVQMGLSMTLLLAGVLNRQGGVAIRVVLAIMWCGAAAILLASGSRTGMIVALLSSGPFLLLRTRGVPFSLLLLVPVGALALIGAMSAGHDPFSFLDSEAFSRGAAGGATSVNTRMAAWTELWGKVNENPFLGSGVMSGYSESSYLRGWATYGMLYPLLLLVLLAGIVLRFASLRRFTSFTREAALAFSLLIGLMTGALFEAYLTDTLSMPIETFALCLVLLDQMAKEVRSSRPGQRRSPGASVRAMHPRNDQAAEVAGGGYGGREPVAP